MPITVTEDEAESGGYALIDLGALASTPLPRLSIRRQDAEPRHLGPDGWQPEVAWISPLSAESVGGRTIVRFGPAVVDYIPDEIAVEIVEEERGSFGMVRWPYITPAPQGAGVTIQPTARPRPVLEEMPASEPGPGADELPAHEAKQPEAALPLLDSPSEPTPQRRPSAAPIPPTTFLPTTPPPTSSPRRTGRAIAAVLAVLILAGLGGSAWFFRDRLPWPPTPTAVPQQPRAELAELERRYAALLERRPPAADLLAFGHEAVGFGHGRIAFRAFEEADPAASEEAAWELARFYDPRVVTGPLRDAATPNLAFAAYYHALWKGRSARHTEALQAICDLGREVPARDRLRAFCQA